jgi:uncharacterized membrane protein YfcA
MIYSSAGLDHPIAKLLFCFLCSGSLTIIYKINSHHPHQRYFLVAGLALSTIIGQAFARNGQDFVFKWLFIGVGLSLYGSMVYHRCTKRQSRRRSQEVEKL